MISSRRNCRCTGPRDARVKLHHLFKPGDDAVIHRVALSSRPIIEGGATILEPVAGIAHLYRVRFTNEHHARRRFVYPGCWQTDLESMLMALIGYWRAAISPETCDELPQRTNGMSDAELRSLLCRR